MKILIIFICLVISISSQATEKPDIKNLILIKNLKVYEDVVFKDSKQKNVDLKDFKGKLLILNFWATWCAPCKEEMPSLDNLQSNSEFDNLKIFPINIGQEDLAKSELFFEKLDIRSLDIYYDSTVILAKQFTLRGVPTSILFNKEGKEFARIIGSIDFNDEKFIKWLKFYN